MNGMLTAANKNFWSIGGNFKTFYRPASSFDRVSQKIYSQRALHTYYTFTTFCTPSHVELIAELLELLQQVETHMTIFFRGLALLDTSCATSDEALLTPFSAAYFQPETLSDTQCQCTLQWLCRYAEQVRIKFLATRTTISWIWLTVAAIVTAALPPILR